MVDGEEVDDYVSHLEEVAEEAAGGFVVHASACRIIFVLLPADASDFRIAGFRVHEYQSADACFRYHCACFRQLDSEVIFA